MLNQLILRAWCATPGAWLKSCTAITPMAPIKKAAGGFKTTTATTSQNDANFKAAGARQASDAGVFRAEPYVGIGQRQDGAVGGCDRILPGASHTTKQAGNLPDSEVFSRSEFDDGLSFQGIHGYGAGSAYPQGRQHNLFCVTTPSSTRCPSQAASGLSVQQGTETMTTVNTPTTPAPGNPSPLARQQAIENALSAALYFIRLPHTESGLQAATGRAIRAASMLKQACSELADAGRAA